LVVGAKRKARGEEDAKCGNGCGYEGTQAGVEQHEIGCTTYLCDGCDTYTEDGDGETYTLDDLREQANNYMDDGNNGDEFDDLFDAMDERFEDWIAIGAIAARYQTRLLSFAIRCPLLNFLCGVGVVPIGSR
jgi:hypothetical protein